jgi:type IV secretory pathway VirB2 component (pilin)
MATYEQFQNTTLPLLIKTINTQTNALLILDGEIKLIFLFIYCVVGIVLIFGASKIIKKYLKIERVKK